MTSIDFVQDATRLHVEKVATEKVNRAWDVNAVSSIQKTLSERRYSSAGAISRKSLYEGVSAVCNASLASVVNTIDSAMWTRQRGGYWSRYRGVVLDIGIMG